MFKIESYVTPILLSYVDKYVRDFKPGDAQVSLWGGGVALHNLVIKADVLQQEVALPFTLVSGRIHELLIQVPWTKIMSEPIVVTIDTIECVLSLTPPAASEETPAAPPPSRNAQVVEAPPGYMQALVRRIVSNIALRVHHLIVKYVQDDIVLSLNVKHLAVDSAGPDWEPAFADIDQVHPLIRRLVHLDDLTLCLDKSDADGKIRFFQEPLLYRCQLDFRVLTRLISANTRRATSLDVQLRSAKLAWSVSNEQLVLLLRLEKERPVSSMPSPPPKQTVSTTPLNTMSANSAEPTRSGSWSEWAWSWLPSWADREVGVEEVPVPATALPISFNAYLDDVSLVFKIMEIEGHNRKRARAVLEVCATHAAVKSSICSPTYLRVRFGTRDLTVRSYGKCVCGYVNYMTSRLEPTVFLKKALKPNSAQAEPWTWPDQLLNERVVETGETIVENSSTTLHQSPQQSVISEGDTIQTVRSGGEKDSPVLETQTSDRPDQDEVDPLWKDMEPLVYVDYVHERSAPDKQPPINPYDNPPKDFEYSDWVEECSMSIVMEAVDLRLCMGLLHRLMVFRNLYKDQAPQVADQPKRVLTVEENESLSENLPQRRITLELRNMRARLVPWNHLTSDRPVQPALLLQIELPIASAVIVAPLYPHRVCSAASQMPADSGSLWHGARRHITVTANALQVRLVNLAGTETRPCARADVKFVTHELLHKAFFENRNSIELSYHLKIKEMSICGSSARLQAALEVPLSLFKQRRSMALKHTTLPKDALDDEDAVAIDITLEDFAMRGYITNNVNTHLLSFQSAKVTALHEPKGGEMRQAWLLSAPDAPIATPYLRMAVQWCTEPMETSFDYCGIWTESLAMSVDPLLISWLAYKPTLKSGAAAVAAMRTLGQSTMSLRRRSTPPASSTNTRGGGSSRTTGLGAELVHVRSRSHGSSSEPSEKRESKIPPIPKQQQPQELWLSAERLTSLYQRLRGLLLNVELGLALAYVTMSTASAIDCATLRDAMERHAAGAHRVLGICLGRLSMHSNTMTKGLWQELRHDGPTYVKEKLKADSFPWRINWADVSCYTLEVRVDAAHSNNVLQAEKLGASASLKSKLRIPRVAKPKIVLELVTTTITVSVVTKTQQVKTITRKERQKKAATVTEDKKAKYFSSGMEFKPTTLKEFVRGPAERKKYVRPDVSQGLAEAKPEPDEITIKDGPMVSLGINLHADTPPIVLRLEQDQVHIVAAALHCFTHIVTLLRRPLQLTVPKTGSTTNALGNLKSTVRSVTEIEEVPSDDMSDQSEMISIFERTPQQRPLKTFFWLQWVVSSVTVVVASETVKLALEIDDVIGTVDIQTEYNQLKIKLASASIKYFQRNDDDEWTTGVIGGRVLEAREPTNAEEDAHFLSITVTQAQVAALPQSWKEELHPKLLEKSPGVDYMWEVFATLAPLEAVIQPNVVENMMSLVREMAPRAFCPLSAEEDQSTTDWHWPYFYLTAGGIRLLVIGEQADKRTDLDDTIIFFVGMITVNPHPNNPICRRSVNSFPENNWAAATGSFEGRQYEVVVKSVSVQSSRFNKITLAEAAGARSKKNIGAENPALKWSQRIEMPEMVPMLHTVELSCIFAPAFYVGGVLACGPAVELNLVSDCKIEFGLAQLVLLKKLAIDFLAAVDDPGFIDALGPEPIGFDKHGVCPYAMFIMADSESPSESTHLESLLSDTKAASKTTQVEFGRIASDSGVETAASSSQTKEMDDVPTRKAVSVVFIDTADASQFLEVFVTMGVIDLSLYVSDDGSPEVVALRPPVIEKKEEPPVEAPFTMASLRQKYQSKANQKKEQEKEKEKAEGLSSRESNRSLTEMTRNTDGGQTQFELPKVNLHEGNVPLLQITLLQPNIYYWKKKTQKTLQVSLFNVWIALGIRDVPECWHAVLLATAKGVSDPDTGIPPALATLKIVTPINTSGIPPSTLSARGYMRLDLERPVQLDLSTDKLMRIIGTIRLLKLNLIRNLPAPPEVGLPFLYEVKNKLVNEGIENITIQTDQISVSGQEGCLGWDSASLQVCVSARPQKVNARSLVTALVVAVGTPGNMRHVVLQPLMLGFEGEAVWEAWRRAEGGLSAREPTIKISLELDDVTIDFRPAELATLHRLWKASKEFLEQQQLVNNNQSVWKATEIMNKKSQFKIPQLISEIDEPVSSKQPFQQPKQHSTTNFTEIDDSDHFYKDDLRSGAFKILNGGQLPMAYQVMLTGNAVSWRYPHPRAITRIVAFPLPGQDEEIDCVLELYSFMLEHWEPHTYFKLPVGEPRELQLFVDPPETVFAILWRFRTCTDSEPVSPYEFVSNKFLPKQEPLVPEDPLESYNMKAPSEVTAEQLSGVLRVDSYFAPRLLPRTKAVVRVAKLHVHVHNSLPTVTSNVAYLEGYYVSKPLMKTHRVLTLAACSTVAHAFVGSPAGKLIVLDTNLSCDVVDCSTGTMEEVIEVFRLQSGISAKESLQTARARVMTTGIHMAMQVPRLKTLETLFTDWALAYDQYIRESSSPPGTKELDTANKSMEEVAKAAALALEGRVSLWIHNSCSNTMRVGQAGTDEMIPLGPGARLAYRWRYPIAAKRLRFAVCGPTADWKWSSSIPFIAGINRLNIETPDTESGKPLPMDSFLHVTVEESGASRYMHLSGRLVLANMLKTPLLYKVRSQGLGTPLWHTVSSGEMLAETVGCSVVCSANCEMVLKIKFGTHNTCWSGDIPLKECPKENVPWLVKVPTEGDLQFVSVWCRVVRGRSDGRILATMWPLYVLHSHLPLDTDVLIATEAPSLSDQKASQLPLPFTQQTTPGRGTSTHLQAPGTTSARHKLSFQYRSIDCPVTREAVPMHYGVTDTSVFDKRSPVMYIEDVIEDIKQWLERSGSNATSTWPYSIVNRHWAGKWQAAELQPRCDVTVRYTAVRAGGGCSLEIQLCPVVLLCNASPMSLTLRSHDAAPLCKLRSGSAISPPSGIIQKPFYISIEFARETFVSPQLQVSSEDPGRYGTLPAGHVGLGHAANFAILCNQKVALLTLFYEIKEQINVLGVSSSYVVINRLDTDILVSAIVVPADVEEWITLRPKTFKLVPPTKDGSLENGLSLSKFWLRGRWRGGDPAELRNYLCLTLPASAYSSRLAVPIRLGQPPVRRAVSLITSESKSIPIVVTQMKQDGRWVVVVAADPCPQYVVHNHTRLSLAIAQPLQTPDEPSTSNTEAVIECAGTKWWCMVPPETAVHYSTPAHCARFPPDAMPPSTMASPILTFAKGKEENELTWCSPVVAADGEQLLQYYDGVTVKLRVRMHPHSTLLELQDVDQNDIAAIDVKRRLMGAFEKFNEAHKTEKAHSSRNLERTGAIIELFDETKENQPSCAIGLPYQAKLNVIRSSVVLDHLPNEEISDENLKLKGTHIPDVRAGTRETASTMLKTASTAYGFMSETVFPSVYIDPDLDDLDDSWVDSERFRCVIAGVAVQVSAATDVMPLLALHLDRTALLVQAVNKKTKTTLSIADAQIDNLQYDTGQYDFAVVASTRAAALQPDRWPPLWNMFAERETFAARAGSASLLLKLTNDAWEVVGNKYNEVTELEIRLGTLALYVEDAYVKALVDLSHLVVPVPSAQDVSLSEERSMQRPLRLRLLHIHPLDLTLTLHTAVRMYIALDQSPLRLSAFKLHDMMTSAERLTHALTVHYLSAAILGAGWVVGGLELLGAPGALAARLGGATGGVRGVASAAAAALLRSLSAWAGSLARNLDLLAGDEEHARRAAAARRRPPASFVAGLVAGITNFAINILGAVGGLAHHPLVGVAVGETESGAAALRRGLLGALTKPLSATADLVAYAGSGLLKQTGWDPVPEPRLWRSSIEVRETAGWHRDCVRWMFRLSELTALTGFEVLLDQAQLQLLLTYEFLVIAEPETERIVEMIDLQYCTLSPYEGEIIELAVMHQKLTKVPEVQVVDEDEEYQISAAAMARVARYTGAESGAQAESRVLSLLPPPGRSHALHAALAAALHHNTDTHFPML